MNYLSICSGIEAASVAWEPLGWQPVGFSEIEPFPSAVLAHHWPEVPNLGDMTKHHDWPASLRPDLICGGTPCQAFSVAGLRKGLADPRGNLTLVFLGILEQFRPRWVVWENVPGVLSDGTGAFGAFLGGLAELGYGFAYRILDAQHFGVPKRRRRVFVVGYLGDWRRAAAVLFEPESLRGDSPPCREARESIAPTLSARTKGGGGLGTDFDLDGGLIQQVAGTLGANHGNIRAVDAWKGNLITPAVTSKWAKGSGGPSGDECQNLLAVDYTNGILSRDVHGTLEAAQRKGNRGLGVIAYRTSGNCGAWETGDKVDTLTTGTDAGEIAPTLRSMGHDGSHANGGGQVAVAFNLRGREGGAMPEVDPNGLACQRAASGGSSRSYAATNAVRRLTPTECERLQGFPDGHTLIPWRGKPASECPDGPRYKALGNSMAVPVMRWIGAKIEQLESEEVAA